jgi:hypothetical protein
MPFGVEHGSFCLRKWYRLSPTMRHRMRCVGSVLLTLLLVVQHLTAQASDPVRARVQELQSQASEVRVRLTDGSSVRGRVIRVQPDSFVMRQKSAQEIVISFASVADVGKAGSGSRKSLWIPVAIGGAVLVGLCVAPHPIGFLCRSDPS